MKATASELQDWKRRDSLHHDAEAARYDDLIGREFAPYQTDWTAVPWAALLAADGARAVLDIGCGTGRTSLPVAARGPAVIAADMSRGMLMKLREKARAAGLERRIWPVVADAEQLPFKDGSVDGLVCQGVLHHLPDVDRAIGEADRVLRASAWLCLAEPDEEASWLYRGLRGVAAVIAGIKRPSTVYSPAADHERPLSPDVLIEALLRRGYRVEPAYLVHPPILYRFLPEGLALALMRGINRGARDLRRPADILVLRARGPRGS